MFTEKPQQEDFLTDYQRLGVALLAKTQGLDIGAFLSPSSIKPQHISRWSYSNAEDFPEAQIAASEGKLKIISREEFYNEEALRFEMSKVYERELSQWEAALKTQQELQWETARNKPIDIGSLKTFNVADMRKPEQFFAEPKWFYLASKNCYVAWLGFDPVDPARAEVLMLRRRTIEIGFEGAFVKMSVLVPVRYEPIVSLPLDMPIEVQRPESSELGQWTVITQENAIAYQVKIGDSRSLQYELTLIKRVKIEASTRAFETVSVVSSKDATLQNQLETMRHAKIWATTAAMMIAWEGTQPFYSIAQELNNS